MILALEMPSVDASVRAVRLARWHKREGDCVTFGEPLCDVSVEEAERLYTVGSATTLAPILVQDDWTHDRHYYQVDDMDYRVRVIASDTGYLRHIAAFEGDVIGPGGTLAILSTERDEVIEETESRGAFRVVSDLIDILVEEGDGYAV